jgi:hypothetical protein
VWCEACDAALLEHGFNALNEKPFAGVLNVKILIKETIVPTN